MPAINRRALLTAAPALLLPPALLAAPAAVPNLSAEDQVQEHIAALMGFVKASAPAEFPQLGDMHIMNDGGGRLTLCGAAFAKGEHRRGDRYARLNGGRWAVVT